MAKVGFKAKILHRGHCDMAALMSHVWEAHNAALAADIAYECEVAKAGYKSRWNVPYPLRDDVPEALRLAQERKHAADRALHLAFEFSRKKQG